MFFFLSSQFKTKLANRWWSMGGDKSDIRSLLFSSLRAKSICGKMGVHNRTAAALNSTKPFLTSTNYFQNPIMSHFIDVVVIRCKGN
jgi:hypothetical protein